MGRTSICRFELRRAFTSAPFLLAMLISCALAIWSALVCSVGAARDLESVVVPYAGQTYKNLSAYSSVNQWLAVDYGAGSSGVFFLVIPQVASVGYARSMRTHGNSGDGDQLQVRVGRRRLLRAQMLATFLCGGLLVAVPLVVNLAICACLLPTYVPDVMDAFYLRVSQNDAFSDLFYSNPVLYALARTALDFALCGLWGSTVYGLSVVVRNRVILLTLPYVALLLAKYVSERIFAIARTAGMEGFGASFTLFDQLRGSPDAYFCPLWLTLACALAMAVASLLLLRALERSDAL